MMVGGRRVKVSSVPARPPQTLAQALEGGHDQGFCPVEEKLRQRRALEAQQRKENEMARGFVLCLVLLAGGCTTAAPVATPFEWQRVDGGPVNPRFFDVAGIRCQGHVNSVVASAPQTSRAVLEKIYFGCLADLGYVRVRL